MADKTNYDLANRLTKLLEVEDSERFEERLNTALLESDYLLTEILDKLAIKLEVIQKVQSASSLFSTEAQLYRYLDDNYIAWKLWSQEDIRDYLKDQGYPATDQNVDAVINCDLRYLSNTSEDDWAIIDMAVYEARTAGKLIIQDKEDLK